MSKNLPETYKQIFETYKKLSETYERLTKDLRDFTKDLQKVNMSFKTPAKNMRGLQNMSIDFATNIIEARSESTQL